MQPVQESPTPARARFGVKESVYYAPFQGQAEDLVKHQDGSFVRLLKTDEQPWRRIQTVGADWEPLSLGWTVENGMVPSQVIVMNEEGAFLQSIPTKEEKEAALAKVVEIGTEVGPVWPMIRVRPQESCRFEPADGELLVRCCKGVAKITVVAIPGDKA